ncbi:MAG: hypothetical protein QF918_15895 [Pirellulaceae bacterium]|nr:hypothetical protein [Pirellulaceae bacterium]MDP6717718.1 hypothetical protein [Pirellulaceae bacterium]
MAICNSDYRKIGDLPGTLPVLRIVAIGVTFWIGDELPGWGRRCNDLHYTD